MTAQKRLEAAKQKLLRAGHPQALIDRLVKTYRQHCNSALGIATNLTTWGMAYELRGGAPVVREAPGRKLIKSYSPATFEEKEVGDVRDEEPASKPRNLSPKALEKLVLRTVRRMETLNLEELTPLEMQIASAVVEYQTTRSLEAIQANVALNEDGLYHDANQEYAAAGGENRTIQLFGRIDTHAPRPAEAPKLQPWVSEALTDRRRAEKPPPTDILTWEEEEREFVERHYGR